MNDDPVFLTVEDVLAMHVDQIREFDRRLEYRRGLGETALIPDRAKFEARDRPRWGEAHLDPGPRPT